MKQSAGFLIYKFDDGLKVLMVHPGGPLYGHLDWWSIPKGELDGDEDHLTAARREFKEEVGMYPPDGEPMSLGTSRQKNGKLDHIWALEGDIDLSKFYCETFTMEWPPRSGQYQEFPENDRAAWMVPLQARDKLFENQKVFIDRLLEALQEKYPDRDPDMDAAAAGPQ